ncbi:MAG: DUF1285 domain-containing protein [Myxococcales bacterium]|nr:DUF1285 domain-containing protein [Myxococcales bacterium]
MDSPTPKKWHTREDSGIALDRRLTWLHDGEVIDHPNIIEAFNRGVRVMEDGRYQLHFGSDWCFIEVADCAFGVVAVDVSEGDRLSVRLSDRTAEWLDATSLELDNEGVVTVRVKEGKAKARFSRTAQSQLAEFFVPAGERLALDVRGRRWMTPLTAAPTGTAPAGPRPSSPSPPR